MTVKLIHRETSRRVHLNSPVNITSDRTDSQLLKKKTKHFLKNQFSLLQFLNSQ